MGGLGDTEEERGMCVGVEKDRMTKGQKKKIEKPRRRYSGLEGR